eukprot:snap_masked-scaffold_3-processed-gene-13.18-mRNA-1 protein AED:1.00 eAED:1.00 QI:0/0/0/0/1/1/2/0/59
MQKALIHKNMVIDPESEFYSTEVLPAESNKEEWDAGKEDISRPPDNSMIAKIFQKVGYE